MANQGMRRLKELEQERHRDDEGRKTGWIFLYTLFAFKIVTVGIIWYAATSSRMADLPFIIATTWYWLLIPAVGIAGPVAYRLRLLQMRRRRERLRSQEWMQSDDSDRGSTGLTIDDLIGQRDSTAR